MITAADRGSPRQSGSSGFTVCLEDAEAPVELFGLFATPAGRYQSHGNGRSMVEA